MANERPPPDTILLVDDDPTNLRMLYETLKGGECKLLTAKSGEQALSLAAKVGPTLILLDIMMPGIDGFATCEKLKADPATANSAVIFLSALDETKDKVRGLEMGAVDYISKPFDPQEVIARVETHLKIMRLERSLVRKNRELEDMNRRMRLDLEAAAKVQQSFLPESAPPNDRAHFAWVYRPCDELGGDSFHVFAFDERHIGMYMVDVSGHGVPSSLLAVSISRTLDPEGAGRSMLTSPSQEPSGFSIVSPSRVASRLNELYPMEANAGLYFTLLYGVLDTSTCSFLYVSIGMRGPMVVRGDGSVENHDVPAVPIGLFPDADYEDSTLELHPGDRFYLYTDGLNEERDPGGEQFGTKRMQEVAAASRTMDISGSIDALIGDVVRWRGSAHLSDDVAVVGVAVG